MCQIKTCILRNKSVTVIVLEILFSNLCNEQVLHMCMVRTYYTNASHWLVHTLHMFTVVRKRNTWTLPCVTYAYSCTHTWKYVTYAYNSTMYAYVTQLLCIHMCDICTLTVNAAWHDSGMWEDLVAILWIRASFANPELPPQYLKLIKNGLFLKDSICSHYLTTGSKFYS